MQPFLTRVLRGRWGQPLQENVTSLGCSTLNTVDSEALRASRRRSLTDGWKQLCSSEERGQSQPRPLSGGLAAEPGPCNRAPG